MADDVTVGDGNLAPLPASTGSPWVLSWLVSFAFWTPMPQKCDYSWLFVEKIQIPVECPNK